MLTNEDIKRLHNFIGEKVKSYCTQYIKFDRGFDCFKD